MLKQGSVGRRIESCLNEMAVDNFEAALVHLFPAIDNTAKKRYPKEKVGERIRMFLKDSETIIQFLATTNVLTIIAEGMSFEQAIYKFGRTSIMHEGELDHRLVIHKGSRISIGEVWELPHSYIYSMAAAVIFARENSEDVFTRRITLHSPLGVLDLYMLWGKAEEIQHRIEKVLKR